MISKKFNLYRIIFPVKDIERASDYYSAIFEMPGTRVSDGRHYFNLDGTILALYDPEADGDEINQSWSFHENQYLYFAVENLTALHERIKKLGGQHVDERIGKMPWGEVLFYANDPFGNPICFVEKSTIFTGE